MKYKFVFSLICLALLLSCNPDNPITTPTEEVHTEDDGHIHTEDDGHTHTEGDGHTHEEDEVDKESTESEK